MTASFHDNGRKICTGRVGGPVMLIPLGLILGLLAFQVVTGYWAALHTARSTVNNLADVLAVNITATLDRVHGSLNTFAADITPADLRDSIPSERRKALETRMQAALNGFEAVVNHRAFDAEGNAVMGAGRGNPHARFSVADRAWFQALKAQPERDFVLSDVVVSKTTGHNAIYFAKPLRDRDGAFIGAVSAHINLEWLQSMIDGLDIGREGLVTLRERSKAQLIVRRPKVDDQVNIGQTGLYELHLSTSTRSDGEFTSAIDGIVRLYAFRGLGNYPLALVVAQGPSDYLREWRVQSTITSLVALLLAALQVAAYRRLTQAYRSSVGMASALESTNANLKRSNAELEEFAYVASHDLQTPLRNISSFSQLLERRCCGRLDDDCTEFLNFITSNAQRMSELIHDLLAYARIGRPGAERETVDAGEALSLVLADLDEEITACGARISVEVLPAVPINRSHLTSLFSNLLSNALKFRSPDRPPEISVFA